MEKTGIYVHIPFCKSKCYYCDFTSFAGRDKLANKYIKCLKKEIIHRKNDNVEIDTIYFGGGTPSYINEKHIVEILNTIRENYKVLDDAEITIEANPGTITEDKLKTYLKCGINRISIGLQSSRNEILKSIGRIHTFEQWGNAILMAKQVGFKNINTDIIVGLPEQSIYDIEDAIDQIVDYGLQHVSVYSLIVEEGTPLEEKIKNGELKETDEELERYMYWFAKRKLEDNGYKHYEVSNFAKEGFESKHNLNCWNQHSYMGFGLAASSYENKSRRTNISDLDFYIKNIEDNNFDSLYVIEEEQNNSEEMKEFMMLGLRKIDGVNVGDFRMKFSKDVFIVFKKQIEKLLTADLIELNKSNIRLTKKGLDLANLVWEEFI